MGIMVFLIMGNAGFISSTVVSMHIRRILFLRAPHYTYTKFTKILTILISRPLH